MQISEKLIKIMQQLGVPPAGFPTKSQYSNGGSVKSSGNKSRKKVKK